jgi:phosphoglycerate kinase
MGVFENPLFAKGTFAIARAVADSGAFSIIGGGDSAAAVAQSGMESKITHISPEVARRWNFFPDKSCPVWKPLRIKQRSLDETAHHCRELEDV